MDSYLRILLYRWSTEIQFNGSTDIDILRKALKIQEDWAGRFHIKSGYLKSMNASLMKLYYKIYYKNDDNWRGLLKLLEKLKTLENDLI